MGVGPGVNKRFLRNIYEGVLCGWKITLFYRNQRLFTTEAKRVSSRAESVHSLVNGLTKPKDP